MNTIHKILTFFCIITFSSCNFLDIVPDEKATEKDAFKDAAAAERYLYSCYGYIPNPRHGSSSLDLMTGDEVVTPWEHETFGKFAQGNYTPSNPYINYWDDLFKGIRQCYLMKQNLGSVPGLSEDDYNSYMAEADFLIAYYHFYLIRTYGPTILIKELPDANASTSQDKLLGRIPYDECVAWVADRFKEVAPKLPARWTGSNYGRATSVTALALRARLLLYAASPQYNGGEGFKTLYGNFQNPDGTQLISTSYSSKKWADASQACWEAIQAAETEGFGIYEATVGGLPQTPEPIDMVQRSLRFTFIDKNNTNEVIWADCTKEGGIYGVQAKTLPRWNSVTWGGVAPTLRQIERFYTQNGLPIDEDPSYPYTNRYGVTNFTAGDQNGEGETLVMHTQREPRFYSWISFHNGYYEVFGEDKSVEGAVSPYAPKYKRGINNAKLLTQFRFDDNCGRNSRGTGSYTGYLNKKGANPATTVEKSLKLSEYPWPVVRMAELYLNYAEICIECNDLDNAKIYLNKIRKRAGIPDVEVSWENIATLDQAKMRQIVRQERQIELYLENHNFWDLRRWGEAEILGQQPDGLSIMKKTLSELGQPIKVDVARRFIPAHYLMPIPIGEINKNPNMVQNPGYNE